MVQPNTGTISQWATTGPVQPACGRSSPAVLALAFTSVKRVSYDNSQPSTPTGFYCTLVSVVRYLNGRQGKGARDYMLLVSTKWMLWLQCAL